MKLNTVGNHSCVETSTTASYVSLCLVLFSYILFSCMQSQDHFTCKASCGLLKQYIRYINKAGTESTFNLSCVIQSCQFYWDFVQGPWSRSERSTFPEGPLGLSCPLLLLSLLLNFNYASFGSGHY